MGHDLILTARREDRLQALAERLRQAHGVEVHIIPADLSDPAAPEALVRAIAQAGLTVDVLVNNAGYGLPGLYAKTSWTGQAALLQLLATSPCELIHRLLPGMIERGYGRIVNVASLAGLVPGMPGHTLYGPSKAFLVRLSQALNLETRGTGVHVTALCPGFTRSEFHDANGTRAQADKLPRWAWQDALPVVRAGHAAVEANRPVMVTGAVNMLIAALCKIAPDAWLTGLVALLARRFRRL